MNITLLFTASAMTRGVPHKKINYNQNPVLKWCLLNTKIEEDKNDNIRPVKKAKIQRIDGAVSLINAYVVYTRDMNNYNASI